jgi:hypothetical protein
MLRDNMLPDRQSTSCQFAGGMKRDASRQERVLVSEWRGTVEARW